MENPAAELSALFATWAEAPKNGTVYQARHPEGVSVVDEPMWAECSRAVTLIKNIEAQLDARAAAGRDVSAYRTLVPELYERVFMPDTPWSSGNAAGQSRLTPEQTRSLAMMADVLDSVSGATGVQLSNVQMKLVQARDLLQALNRTDTPSLHLLWQIDLALKLINEMGRHDPDYVGEVLIETLRQAEQVGDDLDDDDDVSEADRRTFRQTFRDISVNVASSAIFQLALQAAPYATKAIGL